MYHKFFMNSRQCCIFTCIMKKLLFYIPVLALLMACSHQRYPSVLLTADSLCSTIPDSAVTLLNSLELEMKQADKATRTYYQLLSIKAADKAYITHTSDSLIQEVLQYYIRRDDHRHLPEAYYYAGRVCRDLGDAPQALDYFQKAIETLPAEGEYELKSRIYSQMGTLFYYQQMYEEALKCTRKCYDIDILRNDSIGLIYDLRDIADIYRKFNKEDSALIHYQSAYSICKQMGRENMYGMILSQMVALYHQKGDFEMAKKLLHETLRYVNNPNFSSTYSIVAKLYHAMGMTDSATYYYKALLDAGTIYAKEVAHKGLAEIALNQNDKQAITSHLNSYLILHDSIIDMTQTETLHQMQSLYNYQLREKENHQLENEIEKKEKLIGNILFFLLMLSASFAIYYQYSRRKRGELKLQNLRIQQLREESYKESQEYIEKNRLRIAELEQELEKASATNSTLQKELSEQRELAMLEARQAELKQIERQRANERIKDSSIYITLNKRLLNPMGKIFVTDEEWQEIREVIIKESPTFFDKLNDIYPLNPYEMQICILIRMDFPPSAIAKLLERPKETITSTRRRLYNRIFKEKGKPENWDTFIRSL